MFAEEQERTLRAVQPFSEFSPAEFTCATTSDFSISGLRQS
jgi:hypothetical protein